MNRRGLSLRYKILFLLTAIPAVALAAYLVLAMRVFESDKIAYVFDATSNMSGTVASQIKTQLNSVLIGAKPLFQDYLSNTNDLGRRSFSSRGEEFFQDDSMIDAIVVYRRGDDGSFQTMAALEKAPGLYVEALGRYQATLTRDIEGAVRDGRAIRSLGKDDRVLLLERVGAESRMAVFAMVARLSETAEMFRTSMSQKLYLIDQSGDVIFAPMGSRETNLKAAVPLSFLRDPSKKFVQGAESITDEKGEELLASYSRVGFGDLVVVSTVSREKALSAVGILLRKSLIFFVILLCSVVIVSLLASGRITKALSSLFVATKKVSEGDFNVHVDVKSQDEVGALADNFNLMAAEVSRLLDQTAEKARMESELQTAKTVQETLFPESRSRIGGLEISGFYEPASECGGDWWHYCQVGEQTFLWIGDATGHGAPAALITSAAKSASAIIENMKVGPAEALALLNKSICAVSKGRLMMTFFIASFDQKTKVLTYANASHEAPFLMKPSAGPLKKKTLLPLNEVGGPRLGQDRETVYEEAKVQLEPGDMVFFYTDGIPDIRSPENEEWGERQFVKTMIESHQDFPSAEVSVARFVETFQAFRQGSQLVDDVTFFVVKNQEAEAVS
ncbi:MAG TPA: SpoIIE family protein phosphatase [Pseudobdellovibrionaceae bacterium]|nr:SpoIIE family protein phosphatase [Pseudobdellovibrionaceae bacterium]